MTVASRMIDMAPKPKKPRNNSFVKFRESMGWTQTEMAEAMDYKRAMIVRIEAMPESAIPKHLRLILLGLKAVHKK